MKAHARQISAVWRHTARRRFASPCKSLSDCDAHKKYSVFRASNDEGRLGPVVRVSHDREQFQLPPAASIAVESSGHRYWLIGISVPFSPKMGFLESSFINLDRRAADDRSRREMRSDTEMCWLRILAVTPGYRRLLETLHDVRARRASCLFDRPSER